MSFRRKACILWWKFMYMYLLSFWFNCSLNDHFIAITSDQVFCLVCSHLFPYTPYLKRWTGLQLQWIQQNLYSYRQIVQKCTWYCIKYSFSFSINFISCFQHSCYLTIQFLVLFQFCILRTDFSRLTY
jgi:hypothetical protein